MLKKIILNSLLLILALFVLSVLGGVLLEHAHGVSSVSGSIHRHHVFWMFWRYSLMLAFVFFYPSIIRYALKNRLDLPDCKIAKYSHRGYAIVMCVFYELFLVHNIFSIVINVALH